MVESVSDGFEYVDTVEVKNKLDVFVDIGVEIIKVAPVSPDSVVGGTKTSADVSGFTEGIVF